MTFPERARRRRCTNLRRPRLSSGSSSRSWVQGWCGKVVLKSIEFAQLEGIRMSRCAETGWSVGWFLAGVAIAVSATSAFGIGFLSSAAEAAPPPCVADGDYGTITSVEDIGGPASTSARGTISRMAVGSAPTNCQHISSIYVGSATGAGGFEAGWVIGYSNCTDQTYTTPRLFWWAERANGSHLCNVLGVLAEGQFDTFRVSDINADTQWGAELNDSSMNPGFVDLDFAQGRSYAAMERGASADNGGARWYDLSEYHDANGWTNWDNAMNGYDSDPGYRHLRVNANNTRSVPN